MDGNVMTMLAKEANSMKTVQTVCGPALPPELGHFQMHEHLFVAEGPGTQLFPALLADDCARSAQEVARYVSQGGGGFLDAQPVDAGRNAAMLRRIARASGAKIVCVTGYHLPHFYPEEHWIHSKDEEALSYKTRANSESSILNISVPYSRHKGRSISQSESDLKEYFFSNCFFSFIKP